MSLVKETDRREVPPPEASTPGRRRPAWLAAGSAIVLAWAVPLGTHALRIDWILPILLLLMTASLIRAGRTVVDRLVLATVLLIGSTCAVGVLLSVWPWHLHPVAVAGTAFTGLVLVAAALKRRPAVPTAFTLPDVLVLVFTAAASVVPLSALRHTASVWRLATAAHTDDFSRHFMIFDGIRYSGGYLFMHPDHTPFITRPLITYPQGSHLLYGLLENFLTSSASTGDRLMSLNHLVLFTTFSQVFLYLCVLWAIRWVAGTWLSGWAALPVLGAAAAYLAFGDPINLAYDAFVSQTPGVALMAVAVALLARPARHVREQLVLVGGAIVGVAFVYYLSLPVLLVSAAVWAFRYRSLLRRHLRALVFSALVAGAFSLVMPLANMRANTGAQLLLSGGASSMNRKVTLVIALIPLAALMFAKVRRLPVWQLATGQVATALVFTSAVNLYQRWAIGHTIYYFEKVLMQLAIVSLIAVAAPATVLLAPMRPGTRSTTSRVRLLVAGVTAGVCAAAGLVIAVVPQSGAVHTRGGAYLRLLMATPSVSDAVEQTVRRFPDYDGYTNIVLYTPPKIRPGGLWARVDQSWATLYVGTLQRNYPDTVSVYSFMYPTHTPRLTPELTVRFLIQEKIHARIISDDQQVLDSYEEAARAYPQAGLLIVDSRTWWHYQQF